ncbi:Predicted phosphoesterase [Quadrisphaera granulorum]|uniref:Icc-related predicted phosphoesterase n=1 Tax=Quadrisphaera granulorum TaxID=317664 RepID=A0A316AYQ3_9ACTN|nr:metallophosphoesterase [Quadrisphaera granulorum]PWJ55357.1 Icc-related predicted phosphoesterase [Quadrisphaera granulorum]SZE95421.1 Predicted phosphoesterase [Quadrisphaera granulorum]
MIAVRGASSGRAAAGGRGPRERLARAWARWGWLRAAAVVVVAVVAAGAGMATAGGTSASVGPVDVHLTLQPSLSGGTRVQVPPLGQLALATHDGPLRLSVQVERLRLPEARSLLARGTTADSVADELTRDVRGALVDLVLRSVLVALAAAALACLLVFRRVRTALVGMLAVLGLLLVSGGMAAATANSRALAEPRYSGLLTRAPALVGDLTSVGSRFTAYQTRVAALTGSVSRLYSALSGLPASSAAGDDDVRVLWVSDVHNNPEAYRLMSTLVEEFDIVGVVDTGDSSDFGSEAETSLLTPMASLGVPYLWVRGNHDSSTTQAAVEALEAASDGRVQVLDDGESATIGGVRFAGTGDPRFNPSSLVLNEVVREQLTVAGEALGRSLEAEARAGRPVDVALVHEPPMALPLVGRVPLVLDGHTHRRASAVDGDTLLLTQGSSGGAGLRSLVDGEPTPLQMSVLHFSAVDGSLLAVDDVTVGGVGLDSATVERRTAESYREESKPPEDEPALEEPAEPTGSTPGGTPTFTPGGTDVPPLPTESVLPLTPTPSNS